MTSKSFAKDCFIALFVTGIGVVLAWVLTGGIPPIGIDDAAITRSYSENLAHGVGYVYNVGGERVEGSTTMLWTLIVAGLYLVTPKPEILILGLCGVLAWAAVLASLRIARTVTERLGGSGDLSVAVLALLLIGNPGYFLWAVWTMMELSLWSASVLVLVATLVRWNESETGYPPAGKSLLFVCALALPLVRPEGIAISVGLIVLGMLMTPSMRKSGLVAVGLALVAFAAVTAFRMNYFGQPFPNTFYAKVSSDRMQDLADGLKYLASFLLGAPFAETFVAAWAAGGIWGLVRAFGPRGEGQSLLIPAATVFGFLFLYAALGGDHFALWRFYQPISPLLPVALSIGVAQTIGAVTQRVVAPRLALPAITASLAVLAAGWLQFYQSRFDVIKEFTLVESGLDFGTYLNDIEPRPSIGVGPAGGIALAYDGYIYDLLGLNWTEMAHAKPVKIGMRNHASFDKPTFWKNRPDVLATFNRPCSGPGQQNFWASNDDAFDGLFEDARFRDEFLPVQFRGEGQCWPGFATPDWLDKVTDMSTIDVLTWSDVAILN